VAASLNTDRELVKLVRALAKPGGLRPEIGIQLGRRPEANRVLRPQGRVLPLRRQRRMQTTTGGPMGRVGRGLDHRQPGLLVQTVTEPNPFLLPEESQPGATAQRDEIGRASCRERVRIAAGAVAGKRTTRTYGVDDA